MAKFNAEIPNDLLQKFYGLEKECTEIFGEMVDAGAETVLNNVQNNMKSAFDNPERLAKGLKKTKVYKTPTDDGINVKVAFYGYDSDKVTKQHPQGVPIPLMAMAREYGTSSGERKKPFFRKSFKQKEIEQAMKRVQDKHIKDD
jgi:hypothetical protein